MKNRTDKEKSGMRQKHEAESNNGQKLQEDETGDGQHETSGLPWADTPRLGKLGVADCRAGRCTPTYDGMCSV
jgi:hypothetical protein